MVLDCAAKSHSILVRAFRVPVRLASRVHSTESFVTYIMNFGFPGGPGFRSLRMQDQGPLPM